MAEPVMLAKNFVPDKHNVHNWLMSEKLDGVRALWNGQNFVTRNGNILNAPWRYLGPLRKMNLAGLDGELYMGRGNFNECSGTVRRNEDEWIGVEFHVFDITGWNNACFAARTRVLAEQLIPHCPKFVKLVEQKIIHSTEHLLQFHQELIDQGAEGLILKNPNSLYEFKRSSHMLKLKKFHDFDARVIDIEPGKGKYEGMIGALICRLPNGITFSCGSGLCDGERLDPSKFVDKLVSVKYFELSKDGVPRFPIFKGIRHDTDG